MDDICFTCGEEGWVNSLCYCRECMDKHIEDHHKEAADTQDKEIALELGELDKQQD